jgi:hypothetical protein
MIRIAFLPLIFFLFLSACSAPGSKGFVREQKLQALGTNAVSLVQKDVIPFVPPPYMGLVEGACAVCIAGLSLWGKSLHTRLAAAESGVAANKSSLSPPPSGT